VLKHLDIVCPFAFHRMPEGDITGEQSAAIWQAMCDKADAHLWMDMEAFLFEENALVPRPIAGLLQDLQRFPILRRYSVTSIQASSILRKQSAAGRASDRRALSGLSAVSATPPAEESNRLNCRANLARLISPQ